MFGKVVNIPFLSYKTHAIIFGDVTKKMPIVVLHGGPGGCVERYEALTLLQDEIPLVFYDQLGSGYSKVPKGHFELMNFETFEDELDNLLTYLKIEKCVLLGHSWGGMLALHYMAHRNTSKIAKLILFSTLPSTKRWNDDHMDLIKDYPDDLKNALIAQKNKEAFDIKNYKVAIKKFYNDHVGKKSDKKYICKRKKFPKLNTEIYRYMWGDSELFGTGTLIDYNEEDNLKNILIPTLIISGKYDESSVSSNRFMNKEIKNSEWVLLNNSHHCGYTEEPEKVISAIKQFYFK